MAMTLGVHFGISPGDLGKQTAQSLMHINEQVSSVIPQQVEAKTSYIRTASSWYYVICINIDFTPVPFQTNCCNLWICFLSYNLEFQSKVLCILYVHVALCLHIWKHISTFCLCLKVMQLLQFVVFYSYMLCILIR